MRLLDLVALREPELGSFVLRPRPACSETKPYPQPVSEDDDNSRMPVRTLAGVLPNLTIGPGTSQMLENDS